MELLKKYFPLSFTEKKDLPALAVVLLLYLVALLAVGVVIWILNLIPIVKIIGWILGSVAEAYVLGGAVLAALDYFKVIK